jgi:hypothetical protein
MKRNWISKLLAASVLFTVMVTGCKKEDAVQAPPEVAHFTNQTGGTYLVTSATSVYKIPVGFTTVSNQDRTINIGVTSPTGAVQGTQYTLANSTITIPAGKAVDSITVRGNFSQYTSGRKDTLVFTILDAKGGKAETYNGIYKLLVRGGCSISDIANDLPSLLGDYNNTNEEWGGSGYGPYTTTIKSVTKTSPTTADIVVANIFDDSPQQWNDLTFTLDWSNLSDLIVTSPQAQNAGSNAGGAFGAAYNGKPYAIRQYTGGAGTFDFCAQKITLRLEIGIWNVGFAPDLYEVKLAR